MPRKTEENQRGSQGTEASNEDTSSEKEEVKEEEDEEEMKDDKDQFSRDEMGEALFLQLVLGLQSSAWIHMGKIPNPMTGQTEKNLHLAKTEIDMLMMLKDKTRGNLTENEKVTVNSSIQQLHINFIDELDKGKEEAAEEKEEKK